MTRLFLLLITTFTLSGCLFNKTIPVQPQGKYFERGLVRSAGSGFEWRRCEDSRWLSLESEDSRLAEQYQIQVSEGLPLAVYIEGWFTSEKHLSLLQMLGGDVNTCRQMLPGTALRAGGLEPVWFADVKGDQLDVNHSTALKSWRLNPADKMVDEGYWNWRSQADSRVYLNLSIARRACIDKLGVWYGLTARFRTEGVDLKGCARYGDLVRVMLSEKYYTRDSSLLRQIGLRLAAQGDATLSLIDATGQSDHYQGRWQLLEDRSLLVDLQGRAGFNARVLRFSRSGDALYLNGSDPVFGGGVELLPGTSRLIDRLVAESVLP